jgi:hypothetical protein
VSARNEDSLLAPCRAWLGDFLALRSRGRKVNILPDTEQRPLRNVLTAAGLSGRFDECGAWEARVDVVGVIASDRRADLAFVELKWQAITLRDVGQLLGYCRVCRPAHAFLLSPRGVSGELRRLLTVYGRLDVLQFENRSIYVGSWNESRSEPDWSSLIPPGLTARLPPR